VVAAVVFAAAVGVATTRALAAPREIRKRKENEKEGKKKTGFVVREAGRVNTWDKMEGM